MTDAIGLRLLKEVRESSRQIGLLVTSENCRYFLGNTALTLKESFPIKVLIRLAMFSDLTYMFMALFSQCPTVTVFTRLETFLEEAHLYFQEHLPGYDLDSEGEPLNYLGFARRFLESSELFGRSCPVTFTLGRRMLCAADSFAPAGGLVQKYLRCREWAFHELLSSPGMEAHDSSETLAQLRKDTATFERQASEFRKKLETDGVVSKISNHLESPSFRLSLASGLRKEDSTYNISKKLQRQIEYLSPFVEVMVKQELCQRLLGEECCEILELVGPEAFSRLALSSEVLRALIQGATAENLAEIYLLADSFIDDTCEFYKRHIYGWSHDDDLEEVTSIGFLLKFLTQDLLFSLNSEITSLLSLKVLGLCDAFMKPPFIVDFFLKVLMRTAKKSSTIDSIVTPEIRERLENYRKYLRATKVGAKSIRSSVEEMDDSVEPESFAPRGSTKTSDSSELPDWAKQISTDSSRTILLHINHFGSITELEVETVAGSPRKARAFTAELDSVRQHLPFRVEIDASSHQKVYRKA